MSSTQSPATEEVNVSIAVIPLSSIFTFGDGSIQTYGTYDEPWFCAKQVAAQLGFKDHLDALERHVISTNKKSLKKISSDHGSLLKLNHNQSTSIYINKEGLLSLIVRSRLPNRDDFALWVKSTFGIMINAISMNYKEQEYIGNIITVFGLYSPQRQYICDGYRIDLYFPRFKLAIECDEFGHSSYNFEDEKAREKYIIGKLGCKFIRFNPDGEDFSIFKVMRQINEYICRPTT